MKWRLSFLLMMLCGIAWSQVPSKYFDCNNCPLTKIIAESELKFGIKYSYADSIAAPKFMTLRAGYYSLPELNSAIEAQVNLKVATIDGRYFALFADDTLVPQILQEVNVAGYLSKGIIKTSQSILILPHKVEEFPGVTDADILLSLQQLPGVKSPNETATGLHVRGGTADQNLILWDGIRMYHQGHLFGMISGFNPNVDQSVNYYNKATDPRFGERIASVIDIKTSDQIVDSIQVGAGINALNADVYLRAPIFSKKLGIQIAGRKSFTEWLQSPTFNSLADKVFQNTDFHEFDDTNKFQFQDYSVKLNYRPSASASISTSAIVIDNYLDFSATDGNMQRRQKMNILNHGYSVNWTQKYSDRFSQNLLFYYSAYTFDYTRKQQESSDQFDQFEKKNRITDSGAELQYHYDFSDRLNIDFGYQIFGNDISHSFTGKSQNLEIELDQKHLYNITHAGHLYIKYMFSGWKFQGGARYNYFSALDSDSFEPRAFVEKRITSSVTLQGSFERKSQIMSQIRENVVSDMSLENYVWILSDGNEYPVQKGNHFTGGLTYKNRSWLVDLDLYYKSIVGVTSLAFGFMHQFESLPSQGKGFTKGLEILVQKSGLDWRAWATYTFQDSQNKYNGVNNSAYFPINADITHALNFSIYKKWKSFAANAGWFWHTGRPYSSLTSDGQIETFNDKHLADYHRLDLSLTYLFKVKSSWNGKIGVSVLNAYNRRTVISREFQREYSDIGGLVGETYSVTDYKSLGLTPNVFVKVQF